MKKAMVYGAGRSGMGAYKLLKQNDFEVILVDKNKALSEKEALKYIDEIEFLVKSPGIPYNDFLNKINVEIIDEIELAYRYLKDRENKKIIAITGTNGKTTTTTKIKEMLEFCGKKAIYAGNIGKSFALSVLEEDFDYVVLELSSYQLENLKKFKADISMIINLSPDHLARYQNVEDYYKTKFNILKNQTEKDYFILNLDCELISKYLNSNVSKFLISQKINSDIDLSKYDVSKFSLKGSANLENMLFVIATSKILNLNQKKVNEFLCNTNSLEHRIENFFSYGNIQFINDSKGTNLESSINAINSFSKPILICGGKDKKLDNLPLCKVIKKNVKEVYLIGETANILEKILKDIDYKGRIKNLGNLINVSSELKKTLDPNQKDTVLFSPATSSFDQFDSFEHRGKFFKQIIQNTFGEVKK